MDRGRTSAARGECTPGVKDHPVGTSAGGFDRGWGWMQAAGIQRAAPDGGIFGSRGILVKIGEGR